MLKSLICQLGIRSLVYSSRITPSLVLNGYRFKAQNPVFFARFFITKTNEDIKDDKPQVKKDIPESIKLGKSKSLKFESDTSKLLDIVAHSLYTDKEVFLREIVSNAADALEKARYIQTSGKVLHGDNSLEIVISSDEEAKTITIQDFGVGMTDKELISNLGTIARSGSKKFLQQIKSDTQDNVVSNNLIGQFGVGFYSIFMVSSKVEVYSKSYEGGKAHYWASDGTGYYELSEAENVPRGTKVIIHLKDEEKDFANPGKLLQICKKYSSFVGYPITLNNELLNTVGALWLKDKNSITDEDHINFYQYISSGYDEPTHRLMFTTDAPISIQSVFYVPTMHMEKFGMGRQEPGVSLYSRKVLISTKCPNLLPDWLRFLKGVVDSEDIPLNISRETMQDSFLIRSINQVLTKRLIKFFGAEAKNDPDKYDKMFKEFGTFFKEGVCTDYANKDLIAKCLRFNTSAHNDGQFTSLDEYIERTPDIKNIYYLIAPEYNIAINSPYYATFQEKNIEVIFCFSPIDEFVMRNIGEYNGRKLIAIETQAATQELKESESTEQKAQAAEEQVKFKDLIDFIKETLGERVKQVQATSRSLNAPAIIIDNESASVRKMMKMVGQDNPMNYISFQELHVSLRDPLMIKLDNIRKHNQTLAKMMTEQIYDNALVSAGLLDEPRSMVSRIYSILCELPDHEN